MDFFFSLIEARQTTESAESMESLVEEDGLDAEVESIAGHEEEEADLNEIEEEGHDRSCSTFQTGGLLPNAPASQLLID